MELLLLTPAACLTQQLWVASLLCVGSRAGKKPPSSLKTEYGQTRPSEARPPGWACSCLLIWAWGPVPYTTSWPCPRWPWERLHLDPPPHRILLNKLLKENMWDQCLSIPQQFLTLAFAPAVLSTWSAPLSLTSSYVSFSTHCEVSGKVISWLCGLE